MSPCHPELREGSRRAATPSRAAAGFLALLGMTLFALACIARETPEEEAALQKFIHGFSVRYPGEQVSVGVSRRKAMTVAFLNTPLNDAPSAAREARARDAAQLVRTTYPRLDAIEKIHVIFIRQKGTVVTTRHTLDHYTYPK